MNVVQFKADLFGGAWGLNTTEIAVMMYLFMQDRGRFVFYKNKMMEALAIKDVRTLNKALDNLTAKGIIKVTLTVARGLHVSIIGLDKTLTETEKEQEQEQEQFSADAAEECQASRVETDKDGTAVQLREAEKTEPVSVPSSRGNYNDYPNMDDVLPPGFSDRFAK